MPSRRRLMGVALAAVTLLAAWGNAAEDLEVRGFGTGTVGGAGGRVLMVTRLDDDAEKPAPGMLRWALLQKGPRVIRFAKSGTIGLEAPLRLERGGQVTVDGASAPAAGITLTGWAVEFSRCEDVILTHLRIRNGSREVRRWLRKEKLERPRGSHGLDCVELRECRRVVLDHLSLEWSCDELLAVIRCQDVTVQHCLMAEPLAGTALHPYGDRHAFGILASASTLTLHHCVLAHYWMRGPQFEANDRRHGDTWPVRMEAVANLFADFGRSGSRITAGVEDHRDEAVGARFDFHLVGNAYLDCGGTKRAIELVTKHGWHPGVHCWAAENWWQPQGTEGFQPGAPVALEDGTPWKKAGSPWRRVMVAGPLFESPATPSPDLGGDGLARLLEEAGCSRERDAVDQRIVEEVKQRLVRPVTTRPRTRR
ncbi:MAG: hypothetical protein KDK99_11160 [Verrucomicrobiales bacterium]|nr:hypothetical protein [Verrucomicrobiales bacterium]